jgi:hypothetical protein
MIRRWWGEPLTPELAARMVDAPLKQLRLFEDDYRAMGKFQVPELPTGHLRPSLRYGLMDRVAGREGLPVDVALRLLLYAHEVLMDDPLSHLGFHNRRSLRNSLDALLILQPLAELGALHLMQIHSRARHPSSLIGFNDVESRVLSGEMEVFQRLLPRTSHTGINTIDDLVFQVVAETLGSVGLVAHLRGRVQPLVRSESESIVLQAILHEALAAMPDLRHILLHKLAGMTVPSLGSKVDELVAVRRSSEDFAAWRDALAAALAQVEKLRDGDEQWSRQAAAIVDTELGAVRERIHAVTSRSPALAALRVGTAGFALTGLGAVVGSATGGGRVLPALAGAGSAKAVEVTASYIRRLRERRQGHALLGLAVTFREPSRQ